MNREIKRKAKALEALLPKVDHTLFTPFQPGGNITNGRGSPMVKGNTLATKENLTEEAHNKRMAGLFQSWKNQHLRYRGKKIMKEKSKRKARVTKAIRKRQRIVMEQRQLQEEMRVIACDGVEALKKIITSERSRDSDKIAATQVAFDRGYGKANQTNTNVNIDANGKPTEVSSKELKSRIEEALKRVENLTGGVAEKGKGEERPADIRERDRDTGGSTLH